MNHKVNSWVQAMSSIHCDQTKPHIEVSMKSNTIPPADSPCTSHSAVTHKAFPLPSNDSTCTHDCHVIKQEQVYQEGCHHESIGMQLIVGESEQKNPKG